MRFRCKECGGDDVMMSVFPLEPLKDKKDGTDARTASISEDATLTCEGCGHKASVKLPDLRNRNEVTF